MLALRRPDASPKRAALAALVVSAAVVAASVGAPGSGAARPAGVGFLDSASGHASGASDARVALEPQQNRANLLVAIVAADGPDAAGQQVVLTDDRRHVWTLRIRHVVFGSIIDVFTAPGTGHDAGTVVSSHLTAHSGGEGQALTVAAYANGYYYDETYINGSGGIPRLDQNMPPGADTYTVFVAGRDDRPIALRPGEHPVNVVPVSDPDHHLFQISHTDSHSFEGGVMQTGNSGPVASGEWGLLDVNILPAG